MLWSARMLRDYTAEATDGPVGRVEELYFDDQVWVVRYVVVGLRFRHQRRHVLIASKQVLPPRPDAGTISVSLSRAEVAECPDRDSLKPVTRQHAVELHDYFGSSRDWAPSPFRNAIPLPLIPVANTIPDLQRELKQEARRGDPHLESSAETAAYGLEARDGHLGHTIDFIIEDETWRIPYLAANIRAHPYRKNVLVPTPLVAAVEWETRTVSLRPYRKTVEQSPAFDPNRPVTGELEERIRRHYRLPEEWRRLDRPGTEATRDGRKA